MATNQEIVDKAQQLYVSFYGRPADPGGLAFWIEYFTETDNVDQALVDFGDSDEFLAILAANPTTDQLIDQLYQFMFNRDADDEGRDFYSDLLSSGEASLASIALDIANGAKNQDLIALDYKIEVANSFTAEVASEDAFYTASDIPVAQALLASVDDTQASVDAVEAAIPDIVAAMNRFFTLTDDNPVASFADSGTGVTVILDGDDSETEFSVVGSSHDDTFRVKEYFKATLDGGAGVDTVDFTDAAGAYTINLDTGTFSADVDGLPDFSGNLTGIESVIGSEQDDKLRAGTATDMLTGGAGDDTFTTAMNIMGVVTDYGTTAVTGTDIFKLDINIAGTEFDDMMIGTALPVLQIDTDSTGPLVLSGTVVNIGANQAIGDGTAALPVLAGKTAAHTFLTGLATTALINNKHFVLFATNGTFVGSSQLVAYLITANPTKTASIAASEVHSLTGGIIAALGAGGVMAEVDLILI